MTASLAQIAALFTAGVLEGIGVPWPGGLVIAATAAAMGAGWDDAASAASAFGVGYLAGSLAQYALGRVMGSAVISWLPAKQRGRLEGLLGRYGALAVLLTRPLAVGNYISAPAGMMRMPLFRFGALTFLGIWPWALSMGKLGAVAGHHVAGLQAFMDEYVVPTVVVLGVVGLCVPLIKAVRRFIHVRCQPNEVGGD